MRIGIVSDIHCQADALGRALQSMGSVDRLFVLGDIVDEAHFSPEVVRMLQARAAIAIHGNHDEMFLRGPGAVARCDAVAAKEEMAWLAELPGQRVLVLEGRRLLLVHATPWPSDYVYVVPAHRLFHRFAESDADIILYGHTHEPVVRRLGDTLVVNPGSVGHGRPTATGFVRSFALLDLPEGTARIVDF